MSDQSGNWPKWFEAGVKILAVAAIAVTTALVITGTGGAAAVFGLSVACSAATGGYFNEKKGGSFTNGYLGGAVSGAVQSTAGFALGPAGTALGGSAGTGLGTFLTETLDSFCGPPDLKKGFKEIAADSGKAAFVALGTSSVTAIVGSGLDPMKNPCLSLMNNMTTPFRNMLSSFFGAADDAGTYLFLME